MKRRAWLWVVNTGVLIAAVVGVIDIAQALWPSRDRLEADLAYGWYGVPPRFDAVLTQLDAMTDGNDAFWGFVTNALSTTNCANPNLYSGIRGNGANAFRSVLDHRGTANPRMLGGYWRGIVQNTGSTGLRTVRLRVPMVRHAAVTKNGQVSEPVVPNSDVVEIGDLQPGDYALVTAWTSDEPAPPISVPGQHRFPSIGTELQLLRPSLTHADGRGKIRVLVPLGRVGQIADSYWVVVATIVVFGLLVIGAFQLGYRSHRPAR